MDEQINKIINDLATNYNGDIEVLRGIYGEVTSIASNISNISNVDILYPYINKAVKAEYLARGAEGLKSRGEGSISSSFDNILEALRNDLVQSGLRRVY